MKFCKPKWKYRSLMWEHLACKAHIGSVLTIYTNSGTPWKKNYYGFHILEIFTWQLTDVKNMFTVHCFFMHIWNLPFLAVLVPFFYWWVSFWISVTEHWFNFFLAFTYHSFADEMHINLWRCTKFPCKWINTQRIFGRIISIR